MEIERKRYFTRKQFFALLTIIVMIVNLFSPYSVLINTSYASDLQSGEAYFTLKLHEVEDITDPDLAEKDWSEDTMNYYFEYAYGKVDSIEQSTTHIVTMDLIIKGSSTSNQAALNIQFDNNKLVPAYIYNAGKPTIPNWQVNDSDVGTDFITDEWVAGVTEYNEATRTIELQGGSSGGTYMGDGDICVTLSFKLADGVTIEDLTSDAFTLVSKTGIKDGLQIWYYDSEGHQHASVGANYLVFEGFAGPKKTITSITLDTNMDKTKYYVGEDIDFTGASITITYDNGDTETITDINQAITDGIITIDETKASANKKIVITSGEKTCDIPYNIVTGISVAQNPTETEYEHGDTIDLTGGKVTVTYDNGDTEEIDMTSSLLTSTPTKADVNNGVVTLLYKDGTSTATLPLTIADPVVSITITNNPNDVEYDDTEPINFTGGTIKATKKSGAEITGISMTDSAVTKSATNADINSCTDKATNPSTGLAVGKQTITVTYEGKSDTFDILVNDTISTIAVKNQPTAKNKYGTAGNSLNLTGATLEITTGSGQTLTTPINVGMLDLSSYNSNTLDVQNIAVNYAGKTTTAGNGVNITLKDYITGITVTAPNDVTTIYDNELTSTDISGVTYVKNYASGVPSSSIPVTLDMISGYKKKPSASTFDSNHISTQTVTVTLNTADDSDIDIIPATDNLTIKVKDKVTGITVSNRPNTTTFNYNGTFSAMGGRIKRTYASGALDSGSGVSMTDSSVTITETDGTEVNMTPEASEFTNGRVTKTLKVTYTDETGTYSTELTNIIIKDIFKEMAIKTDATKKFNHGDAFSTGSGQLTLTYESGATRDIDIDDGTTITETIGGGSVNMSPQATDYTNNTLTKNITVSYTEGTVTDTVNYDITIINDIREISVYTTPKTKYNINDKLELTNGEIQVKRAVGTDEIISMEDSNVTVIGFKADKEYTQLPLTVSYTENGITKTTEYKIDVSDSITSIEIKNPPTEAKYGEDIDLSETTIEIERGSGTETIPVTKEMIKDYDPDKIGEQEVTIEYGGQTEKIIITVKDYVKEIIIDPESITKPLNTELADIIKDVKYTVVYAKAGAKTPSEALTESMIKTVYDKTKAGEQDLTVTYTDTNANIFAEANSATASLKVTLLDALTGVTVTGTARNTAYNHGETLDFTGISIYEQYASDIQGSKGTPVAIENATITDITEGETGAQDATTNLPANVFASNNTVTRKIRVSYSKDGKEDHVDFDITVKNILDHIEIATSPKTSYEKGDPIANAGGTIKIYRKADTANSTETINITDDMITGLATSKVGQDFEATVTYEEEDAHGKKITKDDTYNYNVTETVQSITLNPGPDKTEYIYGETIDLKGAYIDIIKGNGTTDRIAVTENMISGFVSTPNPNDLPSTQTITVTYGKHADGTAATVTFEVTVKDKEIGIKLTPPEKTTYKYGEELDLTGGFVQKVMVSGAETEKVALTDPSVKVTGFDPKKIGAQTVKVTYEGETKTFPVTVEENVISIKIVDYPKQSYEYGEKLDVTGGTIEVTRANGDKEIIPMTKDMVTGFNPNQTGSQKLTVTYGGQTDSYDIEVTDNIAGIIITPPKKLVYNIGEKINLTGGKVSEVTASGNTKTPVDMTLEMISGFDTSSEGPKTITVTYKGKKATFSITVVDPLSDIQIVTLPNKLTYKYGEKLDVTGGTIQITKVSGEKQTINMTSNMITGHNPNKVGQQTLKVTYEGITKEFIVTVEDYVKKLIVKAPNKTEYEYGEDLNLAGGRVSIVMASGAVEENVEITASMLSGYNKTKEGAQTIKVEYKGLQGNFQVKVIDKTKGISMNTLPNKTNYKYSENLDITGGTIKVTKSSGSYIVKITKDMVSGYNKNKVGQQVITVTYAGFTTEFVVIVAKKTSTKPSTTTPSTKPSNNTPIIEEPIIEEPIIEEPIIEEPITPIEDPVIETPKSKEPVIEKPTEVLGVKDKQNNNIGKILAGCIGAIGLLFLLLLIVFKRNVEVYVFEDGEFVLGGKDKISKKNARIDVDKFLDEETYPNQVKIRLSDSISEKLDGKEIEINHRGKTIKHTIKYNDEEYEIILK